MTKSFCGNDCELCTKKEELGCWGCTDEKNRIQYRTCEIANCCWSMKHESCGTCYAREECDRLEKRGEMPSYRIGQRDAEAARKADVLRKAPFMSKWLMALFGVMVVSAIVNFLSGDNIKELLPELYYIASIVSIICGILHVIILLKLSSEEALYRTAAYCVLGAVVLGIGGIVALIVDTNSSAYLGFALLVSIGAVIVTFAGEYYEFKSHANAVRDASAEMAEKWEELWGYYVKLLIALVVTVLFAGVLPVIGAIAVILLGIGLLVISVMKIVYVYQTAKLFQAKCSI